MLLRLLEELRVTVGSVPKTVLTCIAYTDTNYYDADKNTIIRKKKKRNLSERWCRFDEEKWLILTNGG